MIGRINQFYSFEFLNFDFFHLLFYDCVSLNEGDACKEATCYIESWFTKLVIAENLKNLKVPDYEGLKVENGFDKDTMCRPPITHHAPEKFCCGTHEYNTKRVLRRSQDFPRECCQDDLTGVFRTYDPSMLNCCDDAHPRLSC